MANRSFNVVLRNTRYSTRSEWLKSLFFANSGVQDRRVILMGLSGHRMYGMCTGYEQDMNGIYKGYVRDRNGIQNWKYCTEVY